MTALVTGGTKGIGFVFLLQNALFLSFHLKTQSKVDTCMNA